MSLDAKFEPVRTAFYEAVEKFFKKIASFLGYPENIGMPTMPILSNKEYARLEFIEKLPTHETSWPPPQRPETVFEILFGSAPKVESVPRYFYETTEEGFYNFYIENFKNIYFLPDWLSEFIQVKLHICLDITVLETIREVLFVGLVIYSQIVILRIALSWFIYINPYTFPWCYLVAAVDWTEDVLQGVVPAILGVNITGSVFLGILGVVADSLNHLVFTMPFLPSEGVESKLFLREQMRDVLVFHYLPVLWYRYPIPNEIREFWYKERPDILNYMQKAYQDLDIQFLPDNIVNELNQQKLLETIDTIDPELNSLHARSNIYLSSEILSNDHFLQPESLLTNLSFIKEQFHNLFLNHPDKFL